ncbi:hypothetical protein QEH42_gp211 [Microbacterium phage Pumpernickel]|uniref:Uncharacterized protein n=1 Tax=Microbacterium phage Pumpernickel TaxID=2885983 RepID=A0AAE9C2Z1_9CAUD|nr:hypothetical protein QEH42_gp211 [Microbacterium phage Pumpernickel]UDL16007.1 hypothetical protein SEA_PUMPERNICKEL_257 [Microbacterium phage Pumpernickel]
MKVYVVAWNYPYEGYGEPHAVYATLEAAEKAIKGKKIGAFDETPEIFELEVQGLEYEYGTRWTLSEEAHLPGTVATYPERSLEEANETIRLDMKASYSAEPRGIIVRRPVVEWEEAEG